MEIELVKQFLILEDNYPAMVLDDYSIRIQFMAGGKYGGRFISYEEYKVMTADPTNIPIPIMALDRFYRKDWEEYLNSIVKPIIMQPDR